MFPGGVVVPAVFAGPVDQVRHFPQRLVEFGAGEASGGAHDPAGSGCYAAAWIRPSYTALFWPRTRPAAG